MSPSRLNLISLSLLLAVAIPASAQDNPAPAPAAAAGVFAQGFDQTLYKGLVGNVLDAIPMDPSGRLGLQRTNAVVSNTFLGRSLTVLVGLSNPVLLLGGFVWGIWAASNIKPAVPVVNPGTDPDRDGGDIAAQERLVALLERTSAEYDAVESAHAEPVLLSSIAAGDADEVAGSHPHVIKVWLPQRLSGLPQ
jgi:hypothetical protein